MGGAGGIACSVSSHVVYHHGGEGVGIVEGMAGCGIGFGAPAAVVPRVVCGCGVNSQCGEDADKICGC